MPNKKILANTVVMGGAAQVTLESYIASLSPTFWLQADYGQNANYSNNDAVGTGYDASVNQLDVTQATADNKPTYKTGVLNTTLPAFYFDGNDSLTKASVAGTTLFSTNQGTTYFVLKQDGADANHNWFSWLSPDTSNGKSFALSTNDSLYGNFYNATAGNGRIVDTQPAGWDDTWHAVECTSKTDTNARIVVDGVNAVTGTLSGTLTVSGSSTLSIGNQGAVYPTGWIYLILNFKTALTDAQLTILNGLIEARTGIDIFPFSFTLATGQGRNMIYQADGSDQADIVVSGTIALSGTNDMEAEWA